MSTWTLGTVAVTRVNDPGFELLLPQDESTRSALQDAPWLRPHFATEEWALRVDSSATIVASGSHPQDDPAEKLMTLWRAGRIEPTEGTKELAPGVRLEDAPGHHPGHHVVWAGDGEECAVVVGHLFLHPAQVARPEVSTGDIDPKLLVRTRRDLLARCVDPPALLIGPLFAPPGASRVQPDGDTWRLAV